MADDIRKWIYDALDAAQKINAFVHGKTIEMYSGDDLLRSAVERQFEILGEALKRVREKDERAIEQIEGWRGAVSFRNILAHGYDIVENEIVFGIIEKDLPILLGSLARQLDKLS